MGISTSLSIYQVEQFSKYNSNSSNVIVSSIIETVQKILNCFIRLFKHLPCRIKKLWRFQNSVLHHIQFQNRSSIIIILRRLDLSYFSSFVLELARVSSDEITSLSSRHISRSMRTKANSISHLHFLQLDPVKIQ